MINSVEELCNKALEYLLSINIGNKNKVYVPSGYLSSNSNLRKYTFNIKYPSVNKTNTIPSTIFVKTSDNIPTAYLNAVNDDKITDDWNSYSETYIYSKMSRNKHVSISSMFMFLYFFRYFVDKKFCMFTDIYASSSVWLYNTKDVTYTPNNILLEEDKILNVSDINNYMNTLINEITSRDTLKVLKASTSCNSCSSSSSSSSSSCSSSSSFIVYFNLG